MNEPGRFAPPGVQPAAGGRIQCLECGRWYGQLCVHLRVHGLTADAYRARHGLRVHQPLTAPDVSARMAAAATAVRDARPDIRERTEQAMRKRVAKRTDGTASRRARETAEDWERREQLRRERAERTAARNQAAGKETLRQLEACARRLGHASLPAYFALDLPDRVVAEQLGMSRSRVSAIRVEVTGQRRRPGPKRSG